MAVNSLSDMKILVAEDSRPIRLVLKTFISQLEIDPDFAENGTDAYESLIKNEYDLIFMDIRMPGMDGREVIKAIRDKGINTPAIAMTAEDDTPLLAQCLDSGFNHFLPKPILKEELFHLIMQAYETMNQ